MQTLFKDPCAGVIALASAFLSRAEFSHMKPAPVPLSKALEVLRHLPSERTMARIEPLNLIDAGAGVLGQVEDGNLPVNENNSHADGGVPKAVDAALSVRCWIVLQNQEIWKLPP
jgi:hypothetical protein